MQMSIVCWLFLLANLSKCEAFALFKHTFGKWYLLSFDLDKIFYAMLCSINTAMKSKCFSNECTIDLNPTLNPVIKYMT